MKHDLYVSKLSAISIAIALSACGGGGGTPDTPAVSTLTGTAATGAALANAPVAVTNSAGTSPCQESTITTSALGSYTCTLKANEVAPFFIVVTDPTGNSAPLASVATTTPTAGTPLTVNATPLTTAILAQLSSDGNALTLVSSHAVNASDLQNVTAKVVTQLAAALTSVNAPAGYNPFTTSITAATAAGTGNTADMILDVVKVSRDPATGQLALSTISDPTPVLLASTNSAGSAVAAPSAGVSTLSQAAQISVKTFNDCFAVPTAQRVVAKDTSISLANGGPQVNDAAQACWNITSNVSNLAGFDYRHNGYTAGQRFYNLMTSDTMTGAKFSVPEIVAFYPKDPTLPNTNPGFYDRAVLNFKYLDSAGNPGNFIDVAALIPGATSATRATEWWLVGNQHTVDINARFNIRRVEQFKPGVTFASVPSGNKFSTFQSGFQFNINPNGPGSVLNGASLQFGKVTGPGLPANGVVYVRSTASALNAMDVYSRNGFAGGSQCGSGTSPNPTSNCNNIWLSKTQGITGTAAKTLTTNSAGFNWAQPTDGFDSSLMVKGARYRIDLYYGADQATAMASQPAVTLHKTMLTDMVQATQGVDLFWNTPGAQTLAALDPNGTMTGAYANNLTVDWVQNPSAEQIDSVNAVIDVTNGSNGPNKSVAKGATSVVLSNQTVPAFGTGNQVGRTFFFGYRMNDGSNKTAVYTYN